MAILTLEIKDNKFQFFKDLISNFRFVKIKEVEHDEDSDEAVMANIKIGIKEIRLVEQSKMKATPVRDFLKELDEI
jgi:hypothetical protein